jgi:hypothetical protein
MTEPAKLRDTGSRCASHKMELRKFAAHYALEVRRGETRPTYITLRCANLSCPFRVRSDSYGTTWTPRLVHYHISGSIYAGQGLVPLSFRAGALAQETE